MIVCELCLASVSSQTNEENYSGESMSLKKSLKILQENKSGVGGW